MQFGLQSTANVSFPMKAKYIQPSFMIVLLKIVLPCGELLQH